MERRLTAAEKGKGIAGEPEEKQLKRVRAPSLNTSALIKDNALTLTGRLTNPAKQRVWTLILSLPRKWNIQGRVVGSDLGHNCFQFRFELEEDLLKVLENRPYHFNYWMILLQQWEPIISDAFPSMIPFWIRIKGLPFHYSHERMLRSICQDLGSMENHEISKTQARARVLINGLKPLTKETIIEFKSGEETNITLEYERLENHCSHCLLLSHQKTHCPFLPAKDEQATQKASLTKPSLDYKETGNVTPYCEEARSVFNSDDEPGNGEEFHQRVERHGSKFGLRVSTKQTS